MSYLSNIIFITFILNTPIIAYFEERLVKSEENLRQAYVQSELYKDVFTHDINNILQSLLSGIDLFELYKQRPDIAEESNNLIVLLRNQIMRGSDLGTNLKKLSNIINEEITLEKYNAVNIINDVIENLKQRFKNQNIDIRVDFKESDLFVLADKHIYNMFYNLISNAIVHNSSIKKIISISAEMIIENNKALIHFKITDNGKGFSESIRDTVLTPLQKQEVYTRRGLGLLLVRELITRYEGSIWIENRIHKDSNQGSIVQLKLKCYK